jgi:hypothetical protein
MQTPHGADSWTRKRKGINVGAWRAKPEIVRNNTENCD